jgi:pilus assembly protein CpaB
MATKFGKYHYPALGRVRASDDRERFMLIAAGGLFLFLTFVLVSVLKFSQSANAKEDATQPAVPAPAALGTVSLLSPERYVRAGTSLSDVKFKSVFWPRNEVPEGAVRDESELKEQFASIDIAPGVPVQRRHLTKQAIGVSLPLTPGNRAVSIEVDATSSIEGFALPGTRVDVVLTYKEEGNLTSKVLVQNARVLSLGGDSTPNFQVASRGLRPQSRTITLDASPQDALKISTARELGRLSLLMRSPDDNKSAPSMEQDRKDISGPAHEMKKEKSCKTGSMKIAGKEYIIGCGGSIQQIDSVEP